MREFIELGATPAAESCAQVGDPNYDEKARAEGERYIQLLIKKFPPPEGVHFRLKRFPHDFGGYYEVVVAFSTENDEQVDFAYMVERNLPETWEDM